MVLWFMNLLLSMVLVTNQIEQESNFPLRSTLSLTLEFDLGGEVMPREKCSIFTVGDLSPDLALL